ncbi:MAG TPA: VWA domain-containing protein, partial [Campylobacterales bacterium]|nr:VWA domain-containing protein [Campylobacterales bacterium]
ALNEMFDLMSDIGIAGTSTAIGDALMQGINTLQAGDAKSKVIILLTDGKHNAGKSSPREAVELAKSRGIKIYTIGIGKRGDYDKNLLDTIAKDSGAKSFFASNSDELQSVYKSIDRLEPSNIASHSYLNRAELFIYPIFLATILLSILLWREEERV